MTNVIAVILAVIGMNGNAPVFTPVDTSVMTIEQCLSIAKEVNSSDSGYVVFCAPDLSVPEIQAEENEQPPA